MLGFCFGSSVQPIRRILALGAHSDDIEIGAGGTLRTVLSTNSELEVLWVVFAAHGARAIEAEKSARRVLAAQSDSKVEILGFRDGYFPYEGARIKDAFEKLKSSFDPDLIFTHHQDDLHQDHRLIGELTWNTFRNHIILEYEVPKYDGGLVTPNLFVPIAQEIAELKIEDLLNCFTSQAKKSWFTADTFHGLMRIRGIECQSDSGLAEGFHTRKAIWRCR